MNKFNELLKSYLFYLTSSFGISLTIKANVGVSSFNAMNLAISNASNIKVGTVTTFFNIAFLIAYMFLTNFSEKKKYALQGFSVMMFGFFINFFTYIILKDLVVEAYMLRILLISLGTLIGGLSVGMIISYNAITFPIESVCLIISNKTKLAFVKLRYFVDIISITVSIIVSLAYGLPLYVREGTIISLIILSAAMNFMKTVHGNYINKSVKEFSDILD